MFHSEIWLIHSGYCVLTVSKHSTSGTSLPSRFGSVLYELSSSEVRVSVAAEINRLFFTPGSEWYMSPPVRVDIKISFSCSSLSSSQTSLPIIPQIWPELWAAGLMYAEQNEERAKEKIYKQGHDVKCLVLCLSYVFFIFHIHMQYKYWNTLKRETHFLRFISKNNTHRKIYIHLHRKQKVIWCTSLWSVETF